MIKQEITSSRKRSKELVNKGINFGNDRMNHDTSLDGKINMDSKYKNK